MVELPKDGRGRDNEGRWWMTVAVDVEVDIEEAIESSVEYSFSRHVDRVSVV